MSEFDPNQLTPGVRRLVVALRDLDFNTIDSGDGVANVEVGMEGALTISHVHIRVRTPGMLVAESHRLQDALEELLELHSQHLVQAMYSPQDGVATISVFGATDAMLRKQ